MAAKNSKRSAPVNPFESTLFGRTVSHAAMRRAMAAANKRDDSLNSARERARLYGESYKARLDAQKRLKKDLTHPADITDLRKVGDELAKRKVLAPAVAKGQGGILAGSYSLRIAPEYEFGDIFMAGSDPNDSRNSAFAHRGNGGLGFAMLADQTRGSAFTDPFTHLPGRNILTRVQLGTFFIPLFAPGELRADVSPALSFAWWTVSTGMPAWTFGQISLQFLGFRFDGSLETSIIGGSNQLWDRHTTDLEFDLGSLTTPMTLFANTDGVHFYLIFVECLGFAQSFGKDAQASVAGGIINCVLPFIDIDFRYIPVLHP